jgi:protein TonB
MFETCMIESANQYKNHRKMSTVISLCLQFLLLAVMILIPLIYTEALPKALLAATLVAPPPPPPPPPPPVIIHVVKKISTDIVDGQIRTPTKIPKKIVQVVEDEPPAAVTSMGVPGAVGGVPGGSAGGVLGSMLAATNTPAPKVAPPQKVRISEVALGTAISSPQPQYPPIARAAHLSGSVVLAATIAKDGTITNLHVVSGNGMFVQNAMDAVRNWRYKPYMLNGEPVEVETQITVNFHLGGG